MGGRVGELVLFAVALVERDEDAQVVLAGQDLDRGAGKLGRDLVEPARAEAAVGAGDVKGRHGRVVRRLLRQVGDGDGLRVVGGAVLGRREGRRRGVLVALDALDARLAGRGAHVAEIAGGNLGRIVFRLPVALQETCISTCARSERA